MPVFESIQVFACFISYKLIVRKPQSARYVGFSKKFKYLCTVVSIHTEGTSVPSFLLLHRKMSAESRITQAVKEILEQKGDETLFLVDVVVSSAKNSQKVLVHLDGDEGVNIDTCAEISRQLGNILEEEDLFSGSFTLEVSSPGLDLPLKLQRQYHKNIGRNIKVLTQDNMTRKGLLKEVTEAHIVIAEQPKGKGAQKKKGDVKEVLIPFQEIKKTNVLASFK